MTTRDRQPHRWRWRRVLGLALAVVAILGVAAVGYMAIHRGHSSPLDYATFTVKRGPLTISVTQSGTIKPREQVILKNELEGQTTIIYLIPEGTLVEPGELLVELDASSLQDDKVDQQIQVHNAEAAYIRAREALAVAQSQAESDIAKAELDYRFAQEDVGQYLDGEYPKLLKEAESNITLAKEELERASEKLKWSEKLHAEKYISQTELEADRLTRNRAALQHDLAKAERDLLEEFTYKRQVAQLESQVEQTRMALDRVRRQTKADIVQAEAELKAKDLEYKQQQSKLAKIEEQLAKTRITAPIEGMVIYATSARGSWRGNDEPLDEGRVVREREELIYLPTTGAMIAEVKVHESNLDKVRAGLPVHLTVDALPGQSFRGKVVTIAPLPDPQSMWLNPDLKIYTTQIHLDGTGNGLRTGMTCEAQIIVEQYEDAVYVPVQSVLRVGGKPSAYVLAGQQVAVREVEIGLDNNHMIRIVSGLEPGEQVLLRPPLSQSASPARGSGPASRPAPPADSNDARPEAARPQENRPQGERPSGQRPPGGRRPAQGPGGGS